MNDIPIGEVVEVHGSVVTILCNRLPPLHQSLKICTEEAHYILEVHQHIDSSHVKAITLHHTTGLQRGLKVYDSGAPLQVPVSVNCLGRLLNIFGEPLDGLSPVVASESRAILTKSSTLEITTSNQTILETGIKAIDLLCPVIQ
ncbi:MAG: F0F1 ATP synthase subunit beta, partial [Legionellales bacterium]